MASVKKIYVLLVLFVFLLIEGVIKKLVNLRKKDVVKTDSLDISINEKTVFSDSTSMLFI